jgi:TrmH RNA methyltransferase
MTHFDKPKPRFQRSTYTPRDDDEGQGRFEDAQAPSTPGSDPHEKLAKIAGLQAVAALFRRDPNQVIRLYYSERMRKSVGDFCAQMAKMQRPYRLVEESELQKISGTVLHGGVVAAAVPRVVPDFDMGLAEEWAEAGEPLVILDGIGNPHNVGAIARTLAFFGLKHLLLSDHPGQAGLSDAAHRVAEGGLEYLDVWRVRNLPRACRQLQAFYRVAGTSLSSKATELSSLPSDLRPLTLVLGNEEDGLSKETLAACETAVIIRGAGRVQSLNVSASAAIFAHQMTAKPESAPRPRPEVESPKAKRPLPPRPWKNRDSKPGKS